MAMRTPRSSGTVPSRPNQATLRPVYEDFKPLSEWKEEGGADTLLIYLPGFMREQMRVSTEGQNTIRARGERLLGPNKWSRFQEDFRIPENCNMGGISAKFEGGTLTIKMPRKSIIQAIPKTEAKTTQEAPTPQETTSKQTPQKGPQEDIQAKADLKAENEKQRDAKNVLPFSPQKTAGEPPMPQKAQYDSTPPKVSPIIKPQKGPQEDVQAKADLNAKIVRPPSPPKPKTASEPMYQKVEEDGTTPPKATPTIIGGKQTDGRSSSASPSSQKVTGEPKAQRGQDQTPLKVISGTESKIAEKDMGKTIKEEKGSGEKSKESVKDENFHAKFAGKGKEEDYSNAAKAKKSTDVTAGDGGCNKLESYMEAVKGLTRGLIEERQLMVNMGAAALVLVALGAYITYSFGSSGKPKN